MKISPNTFNPVFTSKKKEIRKADDIQRRSRLTFPVISSTYADEFYVTSKRGSKYRNQSEEILNNVQGQIENMREISSAPGYYLPDAPKVEKETIHAVLLKSLKDSGKGNCDECSKASLAALFANGYYNSERVNLFYDVDFIDKKTKERVHTQRGTLNHCFVVTDMNKGGEKDIVVDSWLGFADSVENAKAKFKVLCRDDIKEYHNCFPRYFEFSKLASGKKINLDDYEIREHFTFIPADRNITHDKKTGLGQYAKTNYDLVV